MKFLLASCLLLGLAACVPSHGTQSAVAKKTLTTAQLPVKSYQEALQLLLARPEIQMIIKNNTGDGWKVKFEDAGYSAKGCDCVPPDSWASISSMMVQSARRS